MNLFIEYYNRPFQLFHQEIQNIKRSNSINLRSSFWSLVLDGIYKYSHAKGLVLTYLRCLEDKAKEIIEKYSITYWLHLTRRIGIGSGGENKGPKTIYFNKVIILLLIQKYGKMQSCEHITNFRNITIDKVFNGLLLDPEFVDEREFLKKQPNQLVLTDFTHLNLLEYYKLEEIAYEIWVCNAKLRAISKGIPIRINFQLDEKIIEVRDEEQELLISSYDNRNQNSICSKTGTVYTNVSFDLSSEIYIPIINSNSIDNKYCNLFFQKWYDFKLEEEEILNFIPYPFPIKKFIKAHLPFIEDFKRIYSIDFRIILFCITSLCIRFLYINQEENHFPILKILQRGYTGPDKKGVIIEEILFYKDITTKALDLDLSIDKDDIIKAFEVLELTDQNSIDINNLSSLKLFINVVDDYYYIDYTTIYVILDGLFNKICLNNHNFRGTLLERSIGKTSYLTTNKCKSINKSSKQIDFSMKYENVLIIAECKVVAMRNDYYEGSETSILHRNNKVIEKGLKEVDDKADWLIRNPIGTNYNINDIDHILPIVISPFIEYIHSKDQYYWINDDIPRVLSLLEFIEFVENFDFRKINYNIKNMIPSSN